MRTFIALVLSWFLAAPSPAEPERLHLLLSQVAGLVEPAQEGRALRGPAVDVLATLTREAGLESTLDLATIARGQQDAKSQPLTCFVGQARTPALEGEYLWFGPLARVRLVAFARPESSLHIKTVAGLKGHTIGVARSSLVAQLLTAQNIPHTLLSDHSAAFRMLLKERLDLWVVSELVGISFAREAGTKLHVAHVFHSVDLHMACHRGLPQALQARLVASFEKLTRQGAFAPFGVK